ncbi:hypothetical protein TNCV_2856191 [Trichonephila clavipes]|nr:hypothetical protein TNCV_2856191 [Trichonephila clavipes]
MPLNTFTSGGMKDDWPTQTARSYVDEILVPVVLLLLSSHPDTTYHQDNAFSQTSRLSQQCLQGYGAPKWPSKSPDISPIEGV